MNKNKPQAKEWLKAAKDDLDSISYLINAPHLSNIVAFHAQQAIEKSLKAIIEYYQLSLIKTHNLEKLYKHIQEQIDFEIDYDMLEVINELYIEARYPGEFGLLPSGKPSLKEAYEFFDFAKEVFAKVCSILNIKL